MHRVAAWVHRVAAWVHRVAAADCARDQPDEVSRDARHARGPVLHAKGEGAELHAPGWGQGSGQGQGQGRVRLGVGVGSYSYIGFEELHAPARRARAILVTDEQRLVHRVVEGHLVRVGLGLGLGLG